MMVHKVELVVVDFEGFGLEELKNAIKNTRGHYTVHCYNGDTAQNSEAWDDDNPLNKINITHDQALAEFERIKNS